MIQFSDDFVNKLKNLNENEGGVKINPTGKPIHEIPVDGFKLESSIRITNTLGESVQFNVDYVDYLPTNLDDMDPRHAGDKLISYLKNEFELNRTELKKIIIDQICKKTAHSVKSLYRDIESEIQPKIEKYINDSVEELVRIISSPPLKSDYSELDDRFFTDLIESVQDCYEKENNEIEASYVC